MKKKQHYLVMFDFWMIHHSTISNNFFIRVLKIGILKYH